MALPMKTHLALVVILLGLMSVGLSGCATEHERAAQLESNARISRAEAEKIALAKVPGGTIKEGGIEKEKGKVIWSFDIATLDSVDITEVNIDSQTGEVVAIEKETPKKP